ncbi:bifunctional heparan sulfate N-deacetylase/N-sulfotransferase-like [Artemia franciscana]|uniref:[heparan sulfate]-glucosamine N-sulfotransferase n=1 Tax=Artemia franciscana TaxID=6661 RepID=A0AA88LCN5_ARTSF|nr:hypothetical protein QYM36_000135 [Artemia franciscana]
MIEEPLLSQCRCRRSKETLKTFFGYSLLHRVNTRKCVAILILVAVVSSFYINSLATVGLRMKPRLPPPKPLIICPSLSASGRRIQSDQRHVPNDHVSPGRLRLDAKVLLFAETQYSKLGREIAEVLVYNRLKYKLEVVGKSLPVLTSSDKGKYAVLIFENYDRYLQMDKWNRELLDKYCKQYGVGIVGFVPSRGGSEVKGFPLQLSSNLRVQDAMLNPDSPILRLTRAGDIWWGPLPGDKWTAFIPEHITYESLVNAATYLKNSNHTVTMTTVMRDKGLFDGIERVLFGSGLDFWIHKILLLDSMSFLSHGKLSTSLDRNILIDVDDIFVGPQGQRLTVNDVEAMIQSQERISRIVFGFRFNLGFSGKYFQRGFPEENEGDRYLLSRSRAFSWFGHMWNHQQPHLYENVNALEQDMALNKDFAEKHGLPINSSYSVAPHHSGVYPVHQSLYQLWKKVWNIKATSTEEYPHLRPARLRRGFVHEGIMVLPRQTCGLYTHTIFLDQYPGGKEVLLNSIQGGELFTTILYNRISVFMTHMTNYAHDRLALYTFESVINFIQCWTNLQLSTMPALPLAKKYFDLYPEEREPVWGNPCDDPRHMKIWSQDKTCHQLPRFLVIGPQKTGTTALYSFLSMHPAIKSNFHSNETFEEIQFFNGKNYYKGIDWYMKFFPTPMDNSTDDVLFEKSATYFDGELVPKRAHALLSKAKIIAILIPPSKRAYSWYHHMRARNDSAALNYTFYQVLTASDKSPKPLRDLQYRCLSPGMYAQHLDRWLNYYPPQQIHLIDGEELKTNPTETMMKVQTFLKISPILDYRPLLRYDSKKGFYCKIDEKSKKSSCLGKSKGRRYPPVDLASEKYLQSFYTSHNIALQKLLKRHGYQVPEWLAEALSERPTNDVPNLKHPNRKTRNLSRG